MKYKLVETLRKKYIRLLRYFITKIKLDKRAKVCIVHICLKITHSAFSKNLRSVTELMISYGDNDLIITLIKKLQFGLVKKNNIGRMKTKKIVQKITI